jgi:cell division protein FtsX
MKNLLATARNIRLIYNTEKDELQPEIEMVLTVYEKTAQFIGTGLAHVEQVETIRISTTFAGARALAEALNEWSDEAEDISDRSSLVAREAAGKL